MVFDAKHMSKSGNRTGKKHNVLIYVVAILALSIGAALAWQPYLKPMFTDIVGGAQSQLSGIDLGGDDDQVPDSSGATIPLMKPWKITLAKNTGGNVGSSSNTVDIFETDTLANHEADLDPSASGIVTTGNSYLSGNVYHVRYVNSNTKQWFNDEPIPYHFVDTDSNHFTEVETFAIGTYVITIKYAGNTTNNEEAHNYNYTTLSTTPSWTVTVENTADNTGYISSYNPQTSRWWKPVLLIQTSGTGFDSVTMKSTQFTQDGVSKTPTFKETSTKRMWVIDLTEDNLTREVRDDGTVIKQGQTSTSFQLNLSSVSGDGVTMTIQVAGYTSVGEIQEFNTATGVDGVSLDTHTILFKD